MTFQVQNFKFWKKNVRKISEFLAVLAADISDDDDEKDTDVIRGIFDFYDEKDKGYITYAQLKCVIFKKNLNFEKLKKNIKHFQKIF